MEVDMENHISKLKLWSTSLDTTYQILHTDDIFTTEYMDQTAGNLELFFNINIASVNLCISI